MRKLSIKFDGIRVGVLIFLMIFYLFPLYWMVVTSLRAPELVNHDVSLFPTSVTFKSYIYMIKNTNFPRQFYNSFVVAIVTTILSTILATLAGYGFSRLRFKGKEFLKTGILIFQMFPKIMLVTPYFIMMRKLGLINTHLALILAYTSFTQPFCIWMLIGFFDAIPTDLDDCAFVDGANRLQTFFKIILPLAAPGVAATALFALILSWEEFLFSLVLAVSPNAVLLPQGLASMITEYDTLYEPMMAGAVMVSTPLILIYIFLEKYFVSGLTAGAVKG